MPNSSVNGVAKAPAASRVAYLDPTLQKYGAFRVGTHDDLVTALGLAVQKEPSVSVYPGNVYYGL